MTKNKIELLDPLNHLHIKVNTNLVDVPEYSVNAVSIVASELSTLSHEFPIFITKNPQTEQYQLTAILGFDRGENLYLQDGQWQATYLPLDILRRPFQIFFPDEKNPSQGHIAVDTESKLIQTAKGEPLFDQKGRNTDFLKRIEQSFSQLMGGMPHTQELLNKASELELLEPISLNLDIPNKETKSVSGLYNFNQEAVTKLSGKKLKEAHDAGILQVCHLVLSSSLHLNKLIKWVSEK